MAALQRHDRSVRASEEIGRQKAHGTHHPHPAVKGLPKGLDELAQLGRTLWRRRKDVLGYFDIGASNGPVEAINGRLEHLRGIALGFKNLNHYILRCLIHSGQLQEKINAL